MIGYSLTSCQRASGYMRSPCQGHRAACLWFFLQKPKAASDKRYWLNETGCLFSILQAPWNMKQFQSDSDSIRNWQSRWHPRFEIRSCIFVLLWSAAHSVMTPDILWSCRNDDTMSMMNVTPLSLHPHLHLQAKTSTLRKCDDPAICQS